MSTSRATASLTELRPLQWSFIDRVVLGAIMLIIVGILLVVVILLLTLLGCLRWSLSRHRDQLRIVWHQGLAKHGAHLVLVEKQVHVVDEAG